MLAEVCDLPMTNGMGCALCKQGFVRMGTTCAPCSDNCASCNDDWSGRNDDAFRLNTTSVSCLSFETLTHCAVRTQLGCTACDDGFFVGDQACEACQDVIEHCIKCRSGDECGACADGFVRMGGECVDLSDIPHCTATTDSRCTKCSFWYRLTPDGTGCEGHAIWWVKQLVFDGKLPVEAEAKELLCVGNASKGKVKLLANEKEAEKATYRAQPDVVVLEKGTACEFEVFVTPHCSCTVKDEIVVAARAGKGKRSQTCWRRV